MPQFDVRIGYPDWVDEMVDWDRRFASDEERMRLAIAVAPESVERDTGGPFGAAIFESVSGRLVAVGMNSVVRLNSSALHGEIVAFMMAQRRLGSFTLAAPGMSAHRLSPSGDPCAMRPGAPRLRGSNRLLCRPVRAHP